MTHSNDSATATRLPISYRKKLIFLVIGTGATLSVLLPMIFYWASVDLVWGRFPLWLMVAVIMVVYLPFSVGIAYLVGGMADDTRKVDPNYRLSRHSRQLIGGLWNQRVYRWLTYLFFWLMIWAAWNVKLRG